MEQIIHRLSAVNLEDRTANCSVCGKVRISVKKHGKTCWNKHMELTRKYRGGEAYKSYRRKTHKNRPEPYRKYVKLVCERCGYEALHPKLMDGHHRDGNRKNNLESNIASLCPLCHRIEHMSEKEKAIFMGREPVFMAGMSKVEIEEKCSDILLEAQYTTFPASPEPSGDPMGSYQPLGTKALLDDVERLSNEVEKLKEDLERARSETLDERAAFWKSRCLKAEDYARKQQDS